MVDLSKLKYALRYGAHAIYADDDGTIVAQVEGEDPDENDLQVRSRDLDELLPALDLIEEAGNGRVANPPAWLSNFLADPRSEILLPSILEKSTTKNELPLMVNRGKKPLVIIEDVESGLNPTKLTISNQMGDLTSKGEATTIALLQAMWFETINSSKSLSFHKAWKY